MCRAAEAAATTIEVLHAGNEGEILEAEERLHTAVAAAQAAEQEAAKAAGMASAHQEVAESQADVSAQVSHVVASASVIGVLWQNMGSRSPSRRLHQP